MEVMSASTPAARRQGDRTVLLAAVQLCAPALWARVSACPVSRRADRDPATPREEWPVRGQDIGSSGDPPARRFDGLGAHLDKPALVLRARVFLSRGSLDEELAGGASPLRTATLAVRARQLVSHRSRQQMAIRLERFVEDAERAACPRADAVPLPRREVLQAQTLLLSMAACLRAERPVYARGMALLSRLLRDGSGPASRPHAPEHLRHAVRVAAEALDGRWAGGCSL
jgi:hypothetical protein